MKIKIGTLFVGDNEATFIMAEAEANHNRNFDRAKKLIDVVVGAIVGVVKFQTYKAWDYVFHEVLNRLKNILALWTRTFDLISNAIKEGNPDKYLKCSVCHSGFKRLISIKL